MKHLLNLLSTVLIVFLSASCMYNPVETVDAIVEPRLDIGNTDIRILPEADTLILPENGNLEVKLVVQTELIVNHVELIKDTTTISVVNDGSSYPGSNNTKVFRYYFNKNTKYLAGLINSLKFRIVFETCTGSLADRYHQEFITVERDFIVSNMSIEEKPSITRFADTNGSLMIFWEKSESEYFSSYSLISKNEEVARIYDIDKPMAYDTTFFGPEKDYYVRTYYFDGKVSIDGNKTSYKKNLPSPIVQLSADTARITVSWDTFPYYNNLKGYRLLIMDNSNQNEFKFYTSNKKTTSFVIDSLFILENNRYNLMYLTKVDVENQFVKYSGINNRGAFNTGEESGFQGLYKMYQDENDNCYYFDSGEFGEYDIHTHLKLNSTSIQFDRVWLCENGKYFTIQYWNFLYVYNMESGECVDTLNVSSISGSADTDIDFLDISLDSCYVFEHKRTLYLYNFISSVLKTYSLPSAISNLKISEDAEYLSYVVYSNPGYTTKCFKIAEDSLEQISSKEIEGLRFITTFKGSGHQFVGYDQYGISIFDPESGTIVEKYNFAVNTYEQNYFSFDWKNRKLLVCNDSRGKLYDMDRKKTIFTIGTTWGKYYNLIGNQIYKNQKYIVIPDIE